MLFPKRFWPGIADGSITVTFRRWKRPQAAPGRPNRTPGGRVIVDSVAVVDPRDISDDDARRAGHPDAARLRAELPEGDAPVYRIEFHLAEEPDPRAVLAADDALDAAAIAALDERLNRLDAASSYGPWTRATLQLIAERPEVRAADLAASVGRERLAFKADVRKLKALGLTESLNPGYRLSPRGRAYLLDRR